MAKYAEFGIKAKSREEGSGWVEKLTGLTAELRESSQLGGNYELFAGEDGEEIRVLRNRDLYDDEPVVGHADDWEFVLTFEGSSGDSKIFRLIESAPEHFEKVFEEDA